MNFSEGRREFIETWGQLAINWGENRTVGMVHAILLVACQPLCTDEIMEQLDLSRGNVNMNLRRLLDLGLIYKKEIEGERKDYFIAEKNMWKVIKSVIAERKKKELDPMIETLEKLSKIKPSCSQSEEFYKTVTEIQDFSHRADRLLETFSGNEMSWLLRSMSKVVRR